MKKYIIAMISIVLLLALLLSIVLLHLERMEWTMRSETTEVSIPLNAGNMTLAEIEKQTRQIALQRYPKAYLSEIVWIAASSEGFEKCTDGELTLVYCDNLGNANGFYSYDRYAFCAISVQLSKKEITKIETYGNFQLTGESTLRTYPDFDEIRAAMHRYCNAAYGDTGSHTIAWCNVSLRNEGVASARFRLQKPDGESFVLTGKLNGLYRMRDAESYLVFVED